MPMRSVIALTLLGLSGGAALGHQMAWSRMFATGLGHETPAMLAVVAAFMGGMALGAWALDRRIAASANPGRWYAALELIVGLWAFASIPLLPPANLAALRWIGIDASPLRHWLAAFIIPALVLLPATAAMGATFPAMERFLAGLSGGSRKVGAVYAANTFGGVAGILLGTFVIAPRLGFSRTLMVLGAVNIACALVAFVLAREGRREEKAAKLPPAAVGTLRLALTVFGTGLLGIGFEVAGTRVLAQVLENTIYTFAAVLSVYLLGTAAGAALYQRVGAGFEPRVLLARLLGATTLACAVGLHALARAKPIYDWLRQLGDGPGAVLLAEMGVAAAIFGPAALAMGATFSHLVQLARGERGGVGRAVALNTLGGALAPALFGVALAPVLGSKWTLVAAALGYVLLGPVSAAVVLSRAGHGTGRGVWTVLLAVAAVVALPQSLHRVDVAPGGRVVAFREGVMATVAVTEEADGHRSLRVNNRFQMGGTAAADAQLRGAHLPLLLHPAPGRALFLGLGTGITLGGALAHPGLGIEGVELVPEVVELMPFFAPENHSPERRTNVVLHIADARRFIRATTSRYDVIVADVFHPARDGAGALYTAEHFRAARERLSTNGLFCQWLPLHQLDTEMLRVIVRTFLEVFPDGSAWLLRFNADAPVVGLVGGARSLAVSADELERRMAAEGLRDELIKVGLGDSLRVLGHFVAGPEVLRAFAGGAALNMDDDPRVTFGAPEFVYRHDPPFNTLLSFLEFTGGGGANPLPPGVSAGFGARLNGYRAARDAYLRGLAEDARGEGERALAAYVESARLSGEFTAGYAQCLTVAALLAKSEPARARALLERLIEAQPARPVAREFLRRMTNVE